VQASSPERDAQDPYVSDRGGPIADALGTSGKTV
jgi:hypothetical protein